MNLRRKLLAFLKSQKKDTEYTELEYLESDGKSWIDTGIPFSPIKAVINLCFVESNTRELMGFGSYRTTYFGKTTDGLFELSGGYVLQGSNAYEWQEVTFTHNGLKVGGSGHLITKFGELTRTDNITDSIQNGGFYLFNVQDYGTTVACRCKISSAKFYNPDTNKLLMDLIPVLDKDFVPCMYDKVSGRFLYNQGDGEFKWKLPNQLECLESDGNQWIDTGLFGNQDTEIQTQFEIPKPSQRVYGYYKTNKNITAYESTDGGNHRFGNKTALIKAPLNKPITIIHNKNGITYDGTLYGYENVNDFETDSTLYVGSINGFSSGTQLIGKLYYFKILQNGKFVQYLIPAFDENLTPCMYDLVSKKYLYNQGSGAFKGFFEDGSRLVSYLESTGTQYIDTGLTVTPTIGFYGEGEASLTDASFETMAGYDTYFLPLAVVPSSKRICMGYGDNTNAPTLYPLTDGRLIPSTETSGVSANLFIKYSGRFKVSLNFKGSNLWQFEDKNIKFEIGLPAVSPEDKEHTMTVFGRKYDNNITNRFMWRGPIYRAIFTDGEQVIMNLVPVVKSDNTACMLDLISKKYFVNAGSGSFSYGG